MRAPTYLTLLVLIALPGCSLLPGTGGDGWPVVDEASLTQHWVHSYEEEPQGSSPDMYRPSGYTDFPPSRFRMQYIFEEGGDCQWYYLAPNDAHHFRSGTWRLVEGNVLQVEQGEETVRYRVVELSEEVLRLRRLETTAN